MLKLSLLTVFALFDLVNALGTFSGSAHRIQTVPKVAADQLYLKSKHHFLFDYSSKIVGVCFEFRS